MADDNKKTAAPQTQLQVRYDVTTAQYGGQFLLNVSEEEVIINFSSGIVPDPKTGAMQLPVHSRPALSHNGAARLAQLLMQTAEAKKTGKLPSNASAQLPNLKDKKSSK